MVSSVRLKDEVIREFLANQNHVGVLTADLTIVIVFLIAWFWFREAAILVTALIYAFFMVLWHYNF